MAYASTADLIALGLPATALGKLPPATVTAALGAATKRVDSYLRGRYALPLTAWGSEITQATAVIAAFELMTVRGMGMSDGADALMLERYRMTIGWLEDVQKKAAHPDVTPQASQSPTYDMPIVITSSVVTMGGARATNRGW